MWKHFLQLTQIGTKGRLANSGNLSQVRVNAWPLCLIVALNVNVHGLTSEAVNPREEREGSSAQYGAASDDRESFKLLMNLATEAVNGNDSFLGKTRFRINQANRTFFYDLSAVPPTFVLSDKDWYAGSLEALIRVQALRRDFNVAIPTEQFWSASLDSIVRAVQRCVDQIESSQPAPAAATHQQECSNSVEAQFEKLKASILTYAAAHELEFAQSIEPRDPSIGYRVTVEISPPKARVRIMTLLEYKKYQYFHTPMDKYQWNEILASENRMIGWYHYRAEWPADLNGPEEGDFEIKGPATIKFTPTQK
jgi:hypothetical protein